MEDWIKSEGVMDGFQADGFGAETVSAASPTDFEEDLVDRDDTSQSPLEVQLRFPLTGLAAASAFMTSTHWWIHPGPDDQWIHGARAVFAGFVVVVGLLLMSPESVRADIQCRWAGVGVILSGVLALAVVDWSKMGWANLLFVPILLLPTIAKLSAGAKS